MTAAAASPVAGVTTVSAVPWITRPVTLPLILPGVLAGAVLGFAKALGEFGATITFVSNIPGQTQTVVEAGVVEAVSKHRLATLGQCLADG